MLTGTGVEGHRRRLYNRRAELLGVEIGQGTMEWQAWLGLTVVFTALLLIVQRAEPNRRRVTALVMLIGAELVRRFLVYRDWHTEGLWAFIAALVLNALFWILIGRSNPPRTSDDIEVFGNE
jgi:hypothetical protein